MGLVHHITLCIALLDSYRDSEVIGQSDPKSLLGRICEVGVTPWFQRCRPPGRRSPTFTSRFYGKGSAVRRRRRLGNLGSGIALGCGALLEINLNRRRRSLDPALIHVGRGWSGPGESPDRLSGHHLTRPAWPADHGHPQQRRNQPRHGERGAPTGYASQSRRRTHGVHGPHEFSRCVVGLTARATASRSPHRARRCAPAIPHRSPPSLVLVWVGANIYKRVDRAGIVQTSDINCGIVPLIQACRAIGEQPNKISDPLRLHRYGPHQLKSRGLMRTYVGAPISPVKGLTWSPGPSRASKRGTQLPDPSPGLVLPSALIFRFPFSNWTDFTHPTGPEAPWNIERHHPSDV